MGLPTLDLIICALLYHLLHLGVHGSEPWISSPNGLLNGHDNSRLLNFDQFKIVFHKHYNSLVENMLRQKIYLSRITSCSLSLVTYKLKKSSSYESINQMSDWTNEEFHDHIVVKANVFNQAGSYNKSATIGGLVQHVSGVKLKQVGKALTALTSCFTMKHNKRNKKLFKDQTSVYNDHRWSQCLQPPKHQRSCASCYIFSVMGLYEWLYCMSTGEKLAFSEQYMLDCDHNKADQGCAGGFESETYAFIANQGVELETDYKYRGSIGQCRRLKGRQHIDGQPPVVGRILLADHRTRLIQVDELHRLDELIERGPLVTSILLPRRFQMYGGGVDSGSGCSPVRGLHSMLLVGHGLEYGREYWLFKNSFLPIWGERGYFKLWKGSNCLVNAHAPLVYYEPNFDLNNLFIANTNYMTDPKTNVIGQQDRW